MSILENEILVKVTNRMIKYYKNLGYQIPTCTDKKGRTSIKLGTKISVRVNDLPNGSGMKVTRICDVCGDKSLLSYQSIINSRIEGDKDYCASCKAINSHTSRRENIPYEKSLWYTHPEVSKLLKEDEFGYNLTHGSNRREDFVCDECGSIIHDKLVYSIVQHGLHCPYCSDGISYPEKFITETLNQLSTSFEYQKIFDWSNSKRYDFYIPSLNCIIETHGEQHYKESFKRLGGKAKTLKEEQENDRLKEQLAKENGIDNYVIVDCRNSELEWIKNNVLSSELVNIFDLSEVNWLACHEFAIGTLVKNACDLWNSGIKRTEDIGDILKLDRHTIVKYLKAGVELDWCNYSLEESLAERSKRVSLKMNREVVQLTKDSEFIRFWDGAYEVSRHLDINKSDIVRVCNGKRKSTGGYKWMYKDDYKAVINHKVN